ncbi:hypothetical protein SFRURICE_019329 [Spodoptera frugiperda]|nr:hypothetical protein SFRURICE_019329 [Spodoptera frugiperda]
MCHDWERRKELAYQSNPQVPDFAGNQCVGDISQSSSKTKTKQFVYLNLEERPYCHTLDTESDMESERVR